MNMDSKFML